MCGIGGILVTGTGHADPALLGDSLVRRGRCGRGLFMDRRLSLHSARHAVIALDDAEQPLHDSTGGFVMVGNGEVLNYRDLIPSLTPGRRSVLRPGDLQVALEMFAEEGPAAFERLRGPFAIAVWDQIGERLTLVRDRLGERALYYYDDAEEFVFASEVRCLELALPGRFTHDRTSLLSFIGLGSPIGDRTLYQEVKALPPGAVLEIDVRRGTRSWMYLQSVARLRDALAGEPDDDELQGLLEQAAGRALVSEGPVAIGFSGGIDSSVVLRAALEQEQVAAVLTVFSAAEPNRDGNLLQARAVARLMGVELIEVPFALPSFDATLSILSSTLDQPCAEPLVMHNNALHAAAARHARVLLGGHGADEVFGGYHRYALLAAEPGRADAGSWMERSPWERWHRAATWHRSIGGIVSDEFAASVSPTADWFSSPTPYASSEHSDPVLFGQALDLFRLMCFDNFRVTDENGMSHGVEVRSPFFDIDLIAGAFAQPLARRIDPDRPKRLLREMFAGTPLDGSFEDRKVGFDDNFPYPAWIEANLTEFSAHIAEGHLATMGILRPGVLPRLADLDWRSLWRLFALSAWLGR